MTEPKPDTRPDKRLAAACGLFCPACSLFIGTREDPDRIKTIAARFNLPEEKVRCDGCRAERRGFYCHECKMIVCTQEKGLDFCGQCDQYPCADLKTFQAAMPHRLELWENLARINEAGYETWFNEKLEHYACPDCGVLNSAYDRVCRSCGHEPSCQYVKQHGAILEAFRRGR